MNDRYASGFAVIVSTIDWGIASASKFRIEVSGLKTTESSEMNASRDGRAWDPVAVILAADALYRLLVDVVPLRKMLGRTRMQARRMEWHLGLTLVLGRSLGRGDL